MLPRKLTFFLKRKTDPYGPWSWQQSTEKGTMPFWGHRPQLASTQSAAMRPFIGTMTLVKQHFLTLVGLFQHPKFLYGARARCGSIILYGYDKYVHNVRCLYVLPYMRIVTLTIAKLASIGPQLHNLYLSLRKSHIH